MSDNLDVGVRVTNRDIYDLLLAVNARVAAVEQTVRESVVPTMERHRVHLAELDRIKADAATVALHTTKIERIEMRVYAIVSGLVAAIFGAKGIGIL
jgi:hypothetical protein